VFVAQDMPIPVRPGRKEGEVGLQEQSKQH